MYGLGSEVTFVWGGDEEPIVHTRKGYQDQSNGLGK